MAVVKKSTAAELDLLQIQLYIGRADRSPEGAERLLRAIDEKCRLFATQPHMGTPRPDLGEGLRVFQYGTKANPREWIVVFRLIKDGIEVVRVFRGGQDYSRLF